ncbi:MAG: 16S rRNA (cytosine(1402)-N(4))-methyltransferase RsmH [Ignavibacteria bacterium]|jgi:16S rRNA (cytosine1402-N4)-methyltransferase|nr:16S rRNA (cytosine(1402)-N(4))-methyltransferase RsmH [Ignavibacteria bacterium]MDH7527371.1 16S rRNA (cytosine(1402)-N(4))-methyltransferase RsmH [Ignavibacteria bacterium]
MQTNEFHKPVLLDTVLDFLITDINGIYFDGTLGGGGYSEAILNKLSREGRLIATDLDDAAINFCKKKFESENRITIVKENFKNIKQILEDLKIEKINGAVLDLGISSYQIDTASEGFSYRFETDFDLRFDKSKGTPAYEIINDLEAKEIADILRTYGEEKFAFKIAREIENYTKKKKIRTTKEIVEIVSKVTPRHKLNDTLSRIFQAFRIYVNDELENLKEFLNDVVDLVKSGGRIVIVSYHSLEDRIVKEFFNQNSQECSCPPEYERCICGKKLRLKKLTKKIITPSDEEIKLNPRSRSAKLRAAEVL